MKPVVELAAATSELEQAIAWYEQHESGLGERLYVAFQEARLFIRRHPSMGTRFDHGTRKWRVRNFPYKVIYIDLPDEILIVAFAHDSRRPGYWSDRRRKKYYE
ncbi:MAG TPA: type II toxin-antitoxin system RelE/ParE family toxin [Verrucomicrobiae bacterium]|jgi:toxin ParE1/3/4